jgi:polysaccharide export outer membrane protein
MRFVVVLALLFGLVQVASADTSYRLRPGDTISVSVWQDSKLDRQLIVGPDGMITVPLVGHLRAGGLPLTAVEAAIKKKLQPSYKEELDVTVTLGSYDVKESKSALIYVTGEVNKPGPYPLDPPGTDLLQAIAMSGGFGPFAATSRILIHRRIKGEDVLFRFNYRAFMSGRDFSGNIRLRPGDVIVVPEKGLFGQ